MYTKQRALVFLITAALACAAGAQAPPDRDYPPPANDGSDQPGDAVLQPTQDPPARVARLAHIDGSVSFTPAGEHDDWVQAQVNRPVVTGDKLWTDNGGRAELQVGASTIRLAQDSSFDFLNLNDDLAQMELTQGTLNLDIHRLHGQESYEVDTPTIAFIANRVGDYRIDVDPQGRYTTVTARRGGGDAVGEGGKRIAIEEGQSVRFNDSQLNDYQVNQIAAPDEFDRYASQREERYVRAAPRGYVSEDVVGYEDLDDNGTWQDSADYGHVWYPSGVAEDWAPYHDGQWEWVDPWGWTWVDAAPWGFAPFHYGRWAYIDSRWGWVPGPVDISPVYAPALVAFIGGGGFGIDLSIGGPIGWFALGPRDVYFPGYRCGRDYFARVNIGNSFVSRTVVNNYYGNWSRGNFNYAQVNYANRNAPRALAAMPGSAFVAGRPVASSGLAVNSTTFANARVLPRATLTPTRASLVAGRTRSAAPPAGLSSRTVVAARTPPAAQPSFAQRQALLQRSAGQPLSVNQLHSMSARQSAAAVANNVRVVGNRGTALRGPAPVSHATANATANANNMRSATGSRSRAPEMNRSPAHANAQYLRSSGFAHQGVVPGSERATNAQAAGTHGRAAIATGRSPQLSATARKGAPADTFGNNTIGNRQDGRGGHLSSSTFAHVPATNNGATARNLDTRRGPTFGTSHNMPSTAFSREQATTSSSLRNSSRVVQSRTTESSRQASRSFTPGNHAARTVNTQVPEYSRRSSSANANYRAGNSAQVRSTPSFQQQRAPQAYRPPARVESQRFNGPAFTQHAPAQHSAPIDHAASMQHAAPMAHSETRVQQSISHSPPAQARSPSPPRQMARSAPQHTPPPHGNDKKRDNNNGGR